MGIITSAVTNSDNALPGSFGPTMNLRYGGQSGSMPNFGRIIDGKTYDEWMSNQSYISKNIIPVVLRYPRFFDYLEERDELIAIYKELIEVHPVTIEGLSSGLTVETAETMIGGTNQKQEDITDVKEAASTLTFGFREKSNKAIQKLLHFIITYGYMDNFVKRPLVVDVSDKLTEENQIYTPDFYTGTVLFIEPDITQRHVVDAWLSTNMFFKSNGERTGKLDKQSAGTPLDLSIESSCIVLNNRPVAELAQTILSQLTVLKTSPDSGLVLPQNEINAALKAAETGYNGKM